MRQKVIRNVIVVLLLIAVDQCSKLAVNALFPTNASANIIHIHNGTFYLNFHIHPELHDRYPLPVDILIAIAAVVVIAAAVFYARFGRRYLLRDIPNAESVKSYPRFTNAAICISTAGVVCSVIFDAFLWGGSLDFICIEWYRYHVISGTYYTDIGRLDIDLKDIFLTIGCFMIALRCVLWDVSLRKLPKSDRKLVNRRSYHLADIVKESFKGGR